MQDYAPLQLKVKISSSDFKVWSSAACSLCTAELLLTLKSKCNVAASTPASTCTISIITVQVPSMIPDRMANYISHGFIYRLINCEEQSYLICGSSYLPRFIVVRPIFHISLQFVPSSTFHCVNWSSLLVGNGPNI